MMECVQCRSRSKRPYCSSICASGDLSCFLLKDLAQPVPFPLVETLYRTFRSDPINKTFYAFLRGLLAVPKTVDLRPFAARCFPDVSAAKASHTLRVLLQDIAWRVETFQTEGQCSLLDPDLLSAVEGLPTPMSAEHVHRIIACLCFAAS